MPKEMNLVDTYMYRGVVYGPGPVQPPDDDFADLVKEREEATLERLRAEGREQASLLPSGHPYHVLLGVTGQQPPQFEGTPSSVPSPAVVTTAEQEMLKTQVGEGDSGVEAPDANVDSSALSTAGTAGSAPGSPTGPTVVVREGGGANKGKEKSS